MEFMASWGGVIVYVVAIVLAIFLGEKLKSNQGIFALVFAFIIGSGVAGIAPANVIAQCFPTATLFLLMIVTFFYGFLGENGLIQALSQRIIYAFRNRPAIIPIVLMFTSMLMSALGAGGEGAVLAMSPLFFFLAVEMGFSPVLAVIAAYAGVSTSYLFWVGSGAFQISMLEQFVGYEVSYASMMTCAVISIITILITFAIFYITGKGYKVTKTAENIQKPEPMNQKQRTSLVILIVAIFCLAILPLINIIFPAAWLSKVCNFLNIRVVMTLGVLACVLFRVGDERKVVTTKIPWNLIIMLSGMMTLITLASKTGTIDFLTTMLSGDMSPIVATLIMFILPCALGAFTGGLTVIIIVAQVVPALAASSGLSVAALMAVGLVGTTAMSMSPYSTGGAMAISGCPDDLRSATIKKQYLGMFIHAIVMLILCLANVPQLIVNWFM